MASDAITFTVQKKHPGHEIWMQLERAFEEVGFETLRDVTAPTQGISFWTYEVDRRRTPLGKITWVPGDTTTECTVEIYPGRHADTVRMAFSTPS